MKTISLTKGSERREAARPGEADTLSAAAPVVRRVNAASLQVPLKDVRSHGQICPWRIWGRRPPAGKPRENCLGWLLQDRDKSRFVLRMQWQGKVIAKLPRLPTPREWRSGGAQMGGEDGRKHSWDSFYKLSGVVETWSRSSAPRCEIAQLSFARFHRQRRRTIIIVFLRWLTNESL